MMTDATLSQLFQEYEMFKMVKGKTKDKARCAFKHLGAFCGDLAAKDVSPGLTNRWAVWLAVQAPNARTKHKGLSPYTVKTTVGAASQVFGWALRQRGLDGRCEYGLTMNPFAETDPVKVDQRSVRFYGEDEVADILGAAAELRWRDPTKTLAWYAAIAVAVESGLRKNEVTNLRWTDIDLSEGRISIRHRPDKTGEHWAWMSKGRHEGTVPLGQLGWEALARLRELRPWLYPFLMRRRYLALLARPWPLPEAVRDNPVHNWTREFNRILRRANRNRQLLGQELIETGDFHTLRKSLGTWLAEKGVPEHYVQHALRHASPDTTRKHYVGLRDRQCEQVVRATINTFRLCARSDSN